MLGNQLFYAAAEGYESKRDSNLGEFALDSKPFFGSVVNQVRNPSR